MEYNKITKNNYNIHLISTNRFKTISVDIAFSNSFNKNDLPYFSLLIKMLTSSTKKYNTSQSLAIIGEELYGAEIFSSFNINGNIERMMFTLECLNSKYTDKEMLKESFSFLKECLFNPNVKNDMFEEDIFNINKKNIITNLKSIKDNPYSYALINYRKNMFKNTSIGYHLYDNINEIEKIDSKDLYEFYLRVLKEFKIDIFIIGNIENEVEYINEIENVFNRNKNIFNKELTFEQDIKNNNNNRVIKEKGDFNQSQLFIGYTFNNLTEYEQKYVINFYNSLLGGINNSLLFTEVREKNSLCYSVSSTISKNPYSITVETEIDKTNYLKAVALIDKTIKSMSKKDKIIKLFDTAKENISTALNMFYDNKTSMIEHYYRKEFSLEDDIEFKRKKYMNIKIEDILNINKKIVKNTTYFLEGIKENYEENNI